MTALATDRVDRRLRTPGRAYDALTGLGSWIDGKRVKRMRRVLYPAYRVEYAYQTDSGTRTNAAVLDGRHSGREGDLVRYHQTVLDTERVDESTLDVGTRDRPGTMMPIEYAIDGDDAAAAFTDWIATWADRRRSDDDTSTSDAPGDVGETLRDRLALPEDVDPATVSGVTDVTAVYLPFWCVEYTTTGDTRGDGTSSVDSWLLAVRTTTNGRIVRHSWIAHLVADEYDEEYRQVPQIDDRGSGQSDRGDRPTDGIDRPGEDGDRPTDDIDRPGEDGDRPTDDTDRPAAGNDRSGGGQRSEESASDANGDVEIPDGVSETAATAFEAAPDRTFADVGGMQDLLAELESGVLAPLDDPERYERYGIGTVNGVLLHGPPGCGKTYVARALAGELDRAFCAVTPADFASKWVGEAAENVADTFAIARENTPCVVFVDELDAVAGERDGQMTNTEQQMVNQLLVELETAADHDVVVVGATNYVEDVDDAILRSGRFDKRIEVGPPGADARREILLVHLRGRPVADDLDLGPVVRDTAGFAASDLELLVEEAARDALEADDPISTAHVLDAAAAIETSIGGWLEDFDVGTPSSRAGDLTVPGGVDLDATSVVETTVDRDFDAVPGMERTIRELDDRVVHPITQADAYADHGIPALDGAVLFGPPGCGKSYLARAVAGELDVPLISITPSTLVTEWDGTPAENVADAFALAKANAPSVCFLDDLDTLVPDDHGRGTPTERRLHNQLAMELRAVVDTGVVVLGATHLLGDVDDAIVHAAAFDDRVEVPPPDAPTRAAVLADAIDDALAAPGLDYGRVADAAEGYAIADLRMAAGTAARGALRDDDTVDTARLQRAVEAVPSTLANWPDRDRYSDADHGTSLRYIV